MLKQERIIHFVLVLDSYKYLNEVMLKWFFNPVLHEIFKNINICYNENQTVSKESLKKRIHESNYKENSKKTMMIKIDELTKAGKVVFETKDETINLKEQYIEYKHKEIVQKISDTSSTVEIKNDEIKKIYDEISDDNTETTLVDFQIIKNRNIENLLNGQNTKFLERSIKINHSVINKMFSGYIRPVLNIIAGLPGYNKTTIALNIIRECESLNKKGMVFSFEDLEDVWAFKSIGMESEICYKQIMDNDITDNQKDKIKNSNKKDNCTFITSQKMNIWDFIKLVRKEMQIREYDYILIDYAMRFIYNRKNEPVELRNVTNELMRISQEYYIPVILLWQLNREIEKRTGYMKKDEEDEKKEKYIVPKLSDLFGSSGGDMDARRIIMIGGVRDSYNRHIYIRKASYSALYDFIITIDQPIGKIEK